MRSTPCTVPLEPVPGRFQVPGFLSAPKAREHFDGSGRFQVPGLSREGQVPRFQVPAVRGWVPVEGPGSGCPTQIHDV